MPSRIRPLSQSAALMLSSPLSTSDEQSVISEKYTEIETCMNEMIDKFIMGVEPLDKFDGYGRRWKAWASSSINC